VWRKSRPILLGEAAGSLVFIVEAQDNGRTRRIVLGPPVGGAAATEALELLGVEVEGFARVPGKTAEELRAAGFQVESDRDNWDYVYRVRDIAELAGRRYHKKRNLVKQCLEAHRCEYEPIARKNLGECLDMQHRWCRVRECGRDPGLCAEYLAVREALAHYEDFQLIGGAVRIDGRIEAFAIAEELSPGTAVCHFEKAMPGIQGLGQVINQWFSKHSLGGFEFANREQDLGVPGLRQAKESYYPDHMVEKFNAFRERGAFKLSLSVEPHECDKPHLTNKATQPGRF
jgi:hypothetical protein